MPKLGQRGVIAHFALFLLLGAGLIAGVYLISSDNPLKLFSKATNPPIVFKSVNGSSLPLNNQGIPYSHARYVKVDFTSTLGPPAGGPSAPISGPLKSTTKSFRYAEDPTALNSQPYQPYTSEPVTVDYTFASAGQKFMWADFLAADGKTDRRSAQIEIVPTPIPTPLPSPNLRGRFGSANCNNFIGWVCDANDPTKALTVRFYTSPDKALGSQFGHTVANRSRDKDNAGIDIKSQCGGNPNHGFLLPTPKRAKDGTPRKIYAFVDNYQIPSPKPISCPAQ